VIAHPDLHWDGAGQSFLAGDLAQYFSALEQRLADIAARNGCAQVYSGSLLTLDVLAKMDYLHSFPQHATFACCLDSAPENLENFRRGTVLDSERIHLTATAPVRALLAPAACYAIYPQAKRALQQAAVQKFTVQSRCFRQEAEYQPLERQWNFTMRELVCIGDETAVKSFLADLELQVARLCDQLQLPVQLLAATDPFFNPQNNPKYIMQRVAPTKKEVTFGGNLAIASLNYHRQYFGEAFDLKRDEVFCHSGCVAFGLERWLAALLRTHGPDIQGWPSVQGGAD